MSVLDFIAARERARKLAADQPDQLGFARSFIAGIMNAYRNINHAPVSASDHPLAKLMGVIAARIDREMAAYLIGTTYTVMLPEDYRGQHGVFYTPPALTRRLLNLSESAGVDWATARVLDPACGGGAFLSSVAERMRSDLAALTPAERLKHIESHLHGFEIDPFGAWMSQKFVELALESDLKATGVRLRPLIDVRDSMQTPAAEYGRYDLVIGNPPYGRIKLSPTERLKWSRTLYGHANLYSLFCDLAVRMAANGGVVAYVTPTSFLGGQYFQAMRNILGKEAPPIAIDFIAHREGVFADVLQETMLSVYRKNQKSRPVSIYFLTTQETGAMVAIPGGQHQLPEDPKNPWLLPRAPEQVELVRMIQNMPWRLQDLGYSVSTGPLVWNRHKPKLHVNKMTGAIPVIWAECVDPSGSGNFIYKAEGRNHAPWFKAGPQDGPNIIRKGCVLLQRTTSLEQPRRLIAAELPQSFIARHGGAVTVENHLNMIRPIPGRRTQITSRALATLLNSAIVDQVFRCINGSTAVSAYELEAMPLPSPADLLRLEELLARQSDQDTIEQTIKEMYFNVRARAVA